MQRGLLALRLHLIRSSSLSGDYLSALNLSAPNFISTNLFSPTNDGVATFQRQRLVRRIANRISE